MFLVQDGKLYKEEKNGFFRVSLNKDGTLKVLKDKAKYVDGIFLTFQELCKKYGLIEKTHEGTVPFGTVDYTKSAILNPEKQASQEESEEDSE